MSDHIINEWKGPILMERFCVLLHVSQCVCTKALSSQSFKHWGFFPEGCWFLSLYTDSAVSPEDVMAKLSAAFSSPLAFKDVTAMQFATWTGQVEATSLTSTHFREVGSKPQGTGVDSPPLKPPQLMGQQTGLGRMEDRAGCCSSVPAVEMSVGPLLEWQVKMSILSS